ncbi:hypothetical protein ACIG63_41640 [Streptomyces antimycoticus]|uniref:hypothetical protein n=1 Tax=Streptomyces antimycoticus TaxID=68175 RepID=UPI0037CD187E
MRKFGIARPRLRRRQVTTVPEPSAVPVPYPCRNRAGPVPDLFRCDFTASAPNTKYVGDITYLPVVTASFCI